MTIRYPYTPIRPVVNEVHGHEIMDHYQWLEDVDLPETKEWTLQQNQLMRGTLDALPIRQRFVNRLEELYSVEQMELIRVVKDRLFYTRIHPGQDQPVLCYRLEGEDESQEKVLLDPNRDSEKGTTSLSFWYPSPDGTYLAYGLSVNGEEWAPLQIMCVETGEILDEHISRTRYPNVTWIGNQGFYYTRYPQVGEVPAGEEIYNPKIYYHELGAPIQEDQLIFGEELPKNVHLYTWLSKDEKYLVLCLEEGWSRTALYIADLQKEFHWIPLITGYDGLLDGDIVGDKMYLLTNYQSPNYRIVAFDLKEAIEKGKSEPADWQDIIPEEEMVFIQEFRVIKDKLIFSLLKDATYLLRISNLDGSDVQEISLPQLGSIGFISCSEDKNQVYFSFQSFVQPQVVYRLNLDTNELAIWAGDQGAEEHTNIQIEQHFYQSKDGTQVPMFIIHRQDLNFDQARSTVLYGYGGFNISITPYYHPGFLSWVEQGGVLAIANLRGGSEYGESWHQSGMLDQKQNVFDDFIWAGKYLIEKGYTDSDHLGIYGRSNGGLLVGTTMTQVPEMLRAVVCQVPLLDMIRYHKFLAGGFWTGEYGDPENPAEFEWLYQYSPYHKVEEGVNYPATFFMTALSDTRVHPLHAMKMAAAVQKANGSDHPVLLKVESESGHGVGKPIRKMVEEQADIWSFMAWQLGLASN